MLLKSYTALTNLLTSGPQEVFPSMGKFSFVYIVSLLPTPRIAIKELNQLLFKFLWKGVDKITRLSVTNEYEKGRLKMIDLETMITYLRLTWLKWYYDQKVILPFLLYFESIDYRYLPCLI